MLSRLLSAYIDGPPSPRTHTGTQHLCGRLRAVVTGITFEARVYGDNEKRVINRLTSCRARRRPGAYGALCNWILSVLYIYHGVASIPGTRMRLKRPSSRDSNHGRVEPSHWAARRSDAGCCDKPEYIVGLADKGSSDRTEAGKRLRLCLRNWR